MAKSARMLVVAVLVVGVSLVVAATAAAAPKGAFFVGTTASGTTGGLFNSPRDVAVDPVSGDVFVVEQSNHRVQRLSANGTFERAWGWDVVQTGGTGDVDANSFEVCTVAAECKAGVPGTAANGESGRLANPTGIAYDPTTNTVVVWNRDKRRIERFNADGAFVATYGDQVNQTTTGDVCTQTSGDTCKIGVAGGGSGQLGATSQQPRLDVRANTGDVYAADPQNRRVAHYESDGDFARAFGWNVAPDATPGDTPTDEFEICTTTCTTAATPAPGAVWPGRLNEDGLPNGQFFTDSPRHVAIGPDGVLYAVSESAHGADVFRFDVTESAAEDVLMPALRNPDTNPPHSSGADNIESSLWSAGMEVDRDDNHLIYAATPQPSGTALAGIFELDSSQGTVKSHALDETAPATLGGFGRNSSTTDEYLVTGNRLLVFNQVGAPPALVSISPPSGIGAHGATFAGSVTPNGPAGIATRYRFEYSSNGVDWIPVAENANLGDGVAPVAVDDTLTGLEANSFYRVRLVATKAFGNPQVVSAELSFLTDTVPPEVSNVRHQQVSAFAAQLSGYINPNNLATSFYFEYGKTTAYGSKVPVPDGDAGSGGVEKRFVRQLTGLEAGETYHYRLVATNAQGATTSADRTFTTRSAATPPEGRAYEMVTTPDKNDRRGGLATARDGLANPGVPSPDGESLFFTSFHGTLDSEAGNASPNQYDTMVIERDGGGWDADAVLNTSGQVGSVGATNEAVAMASDFSVQAWQHRAFLFPSKSTLGTKVFGDAGGLNGSGWHDWLVDPAIAAAFDPSAADRGLITGDGGAMVRWSFATDANSLYRGLLGPSDPSLTQLDGPAGGAAVYRQSPPGSGDKELVNECTGTGADATVIPERDSQGTNLMPTFDFAAFDDDTIDGQPCEAGSVTSKRGAVVGGGGLDGSPVSPLRGVARNAMSEDGRRVFFTSPDPAAADLPGQCQTFSGFTIETLVEHVGENTDCPPQLYVRQYDSSGAATVRWISRPEVDGQSIGLFGGTGYEGASSDGRVVYFKTNAPLVADDPNGGAPVPGGLTTGFVSGDSWDLYRYELPASLDADPADGNLTRVSGGPSGVEDPNVHTGADMAGVARFVSRDGDRVYFTTRGTIAGADTSAPDGSSQAGPSGTPSTAGTRNLYLYDHSKTGADRWTFVARLPMSSDIFTVAACAVYNSASGMTHLNSNAGSGSLSRTTVNCVHGTPDGKAIVFESAAQLSDDDTDSATDIYLYDAAADELVRITAPPENGEAYLCYVVTGTLTPGTPCHADLGHASAQLGQGGDKVGVAGMQHFNLARDGDGVVSVFFESRIPFVEGDTNGSRMDVYRWSEGELSLISPGDSDDDAFYSGNSLDGEDVFFFTTQRIDPREIDDADADIYDARVGGGFPLPPPPPPACDVAGDGCQGAGGSPTSRQVGSDGPGGGNADLGERTQLTLGAVSARALRRAAQTGTISLPVTVNKAAMVRATAKGRLGKRKVRVLGRGSKRLRAAGKTVVRIGLSFDARRHLRAGRRLRLNVVVSTAGGRARSMTLRLAGASR